jgi:flavin reductase (DIM6/NTAB) family NADH-FMN oxidoreductase RutF
MVRTGGEADLNGFTMSFSGALDLRLPVITVGIYIESDVTAAYSTIWISSGFYGERRF